MTSEWVEPDSTTPNDAIRELRIDRFTAFLAVLSVLGTALVLLREVNFGVGLHLDSTAYISAARNLQEGNGFYQWDGSVFHDHAPLFPLVLALAGLFGISTITAAGYINAIALGLTIFVVTTWLRHHIESRILVTWAGCACAISPLLGNISARALSEPLFVLFVVLSLYALDRFLHTSKGSLLVLAAIYTALGCLTRYIGVTVVGSVLLVLLFQRGTAFSARIRNIFIYSTIAMLPIGIWMVRNLLVTSSLTGTVYPSEASLRRYPGSLSETILKWTLGGIDFSILSKLGTVIDIQVTPLPPTIIGVSLKFTVLIVLLALAGYKLRVLHRIGYSPDWATVAAIAVFVLVYLGSLVISVIVHQIPPVIRYMVPIYVPAVVVVTLILNALRGYASNRPPFRELGFSRKRTVSVPAAILTVSLFSWLGLQGIANLYSIEHRITHGHDGSYSSEYWADSETISYLKSHPLHGRVWSTEDRALYLLTDVPRDFWKEYYGLPSDLPDNAGFLLKRPWNGADVYFVWFHDRSYSSVEYSLEQLVELLGLETVKALKDGVVLKVPQT